ncbi:MULTISPECIES: helix-turn-helix transcriptional regulator [Sphingobacterium]|nr:MULTISPECIES: helix-turn-helix transcriptional regulator [Sphingobacterium]
MKSKGRNISNNLLFLTTMNRIKEVLDEKGIKQTWLAEKLGKSFNMVNSYVQNRHQPSLETLYKIAEVLGVSARDLLIEEREVSKNEL